MDSDWKKEHPVWVVGHRGAPRRERENTIASFDLAESLGADAVEMDLQQTRDGELIVFHDAQIPIGTDRHAVRAMASIDVRALLLESHFGDYRIPTLADVFQRYGNALRYILEMKSPPGLDRVSAVRRLSGLMDGFGVSARCLVASFDGELLREVRRQASGVAISLLFDTPVSIPVGTPGSLLSSGDGVGPRADLATPELLAQTHATGLSVHPWTVDDPEEVARLAGIGAASITTNDPEMAVRVLAARRERLAAG